MKKSTTLLFLIAITGCAHFQTSQTDTETINGVTNTRTTRASATTLFDAKSDLAKFKASQSDKTQSATVGTLGQESTTTNLASNVSALTGLINALKTP